MIESRSYTAFPPGDFILDKLVVENKSLNDLSQALNLHFSEVRKLIKGEITVDEALAKKLEDFLHVRAYFWNNIQKQFEQDLKLVKNEREIV